VKFDERSSVRAISSSRSWRTASSAVRSRTSLVSVGLRFSWCWNI